MAGLLEGGSGGAGGARRVQHVDALSVLIVVAQQGTDARDDMTNSAPGRRRASAGVGVAGALSQPAARRRAPAAVYLSLYYKRFVITVCNPLPDNTQVSAPHRPIAPHGALGILPLAVLSSRARCAMRTAAPLVYGATLRALETMR